MSDKRNMEFYNKGYEVGYETGCKQGKKDSIRKFLKIGDRIVLQIKLRYGQDAKGSKFLGNLFKEEFKKLEEN